MSIESVAWTVGPIARLNDAGSIGSSNSRARIALPGTCFVSGSWPGMK
jgi:hypothetical protein